MGSALKVLFLVFCIRSSFGTLQCLNPDGKPVDWYVVYKLPELRHNKNPILRDGFGHFYLDADNPANFKLSKVSMNDSHHAVYTTLQQIYTAKKQSIFYAMYNDQPPPEHMSLNHGHTKGVVAFDNKQGFWLLHSTPHFPPNQTSGYSWPKSATVYGQNFLCVTYNSDMIDKIGIQFLYNYPKFYDHEFTDDMAKANPNMVEAVTSKYQNITMPPWNHEVNLLSSGQVSFTSFAKTSKFNADLYSAWLAPEFQSDMCTETWQNGEGKLPSNCTSKYKVYNVVNITLPEQITFMETKDHSKWAVTRGSNKSWVCIGDINRVEHQELRGGGTVCFNNKDVWRVYNNTIGNLQPCP